MRAWIEMVPPDAADGKLAKLYEKARTPAGTVDNVMQAHSLRPHTLEGHVALYRAVLHHPDNTLPDWFLEAVGSYTSILNGCDYSLTHHWHNARALLGGGEAGDAALAALDNREPEQAFEGKYLSLLQYVEKLTLSPASITRDDVDGLRASGASDGEILETYQVCGYFNYVIRHLNGLGVSTEGDKIGYYDEPGS